MYTSYYTNRYLPIFFYLLLLLGPHDLLRLDKSRQHIFFQTYSCIIYFFCIIYSHKPVMPWFIFHFSYICLIFRIAKYKSVFLGIGIKPHKSICLFKINIKDLVIRCNNIKGKTCIMFTVS